MSYNKETKMYEGYIYKVENIINNKLYIGQTCTNISIRWSGHKKQSKDPISSDYFHNAIKKYGFKNFKISEIEKICCLTKSELLEQLDILEKKYIDKFNSYISGYNLTLGGRGDKSHQLKSVIQFDVNGNYIKEYKSIESLKEIFDSISTIYDCCNGNCKYAYGYLWKYKNDDTPLVKLTNKEKQKCINKSLCKTSKIKQYSWDGKLLNIYNSSKEASEITGVNLGAITSSCTGRNIYGGGFIWRFDNDDFNKYKVSKEKFKPVNQYDLDDNFINVYQSAREAARQNNMNYQTICGVCNKIKKTSNGYKWFYSYDKSQPDKTKILMNIDNGVKG